MIEIYYQCQPPEPQAIWCKVKKWWGTRWYRWVETYWVRDVDILGMMAVFEGIRYVRRYIEEDMRKATRINKLGFLLLTGYHFEEPGRR